MSTAASDLATMSAHARDVTAQCRRVGLKGPNAAQWLRQLGCDSPGLPNAWRPLADGGASRDIIARLGASEFFIEQALPAQLVARITRELDRSVEGVYPVLREDRAFELSGSGADAVLAQMCNVDFKRVSRSDRYVAMTMMIGIAVLVIPQERRGEPSESSGESDMAMGPSANGGCYRIWCDPSYGDYLWSSLQDVMRGA